MHGEHHRIKNTQHSTYHVCVVGLMGHPAGTEHSGGVSREASAEWLNPILMGQDRDKKEHLPGALVDPPGPPGSRSSEVGQAGLGKQEATAEGRDV